VKRLLIFLFLSTFLFNWIGYQLFYAVTDENAGQNQNGRLNTVDRRGSASSSVRLPNFHIALYAKELDFDDLFEFTSRPDCSGNEIILNMSGDLLPDQANKESHRASYKCFNGEYYYKPDNLFTAYPDAYSSGKTPDRYLLKIPVIFPGAQDHPPRLTAGC